MKTFFVTVLFFLFSFFFFPKLVSASENFLTTYDVSYNVLQNGISQTSFKVILTNTEDRYYVSSYAISLGFQTLNNLKAWDSDGQIIPKISKTENGNKIDLTFNKRVVGKGNTLVFNLTFDTPDIAKKQGNIWEINIPGIANQNEFQDFNVHLRVPDNFRNPIYTKPFQTKNTLDFNKYNLGKSGISLAFGGNQFYRFSLSYHLKNRQIFPVKSEIALPPNTNYQDVVIEDIIPKPLNVKEDKDGNWLAEFYLFPSQRIDVLVKGRAAVSLSPKEEIISAYEYQQYLKEVPYWEKDEKIKELAKTLKTPREIYDYVVKTLTYDFSRVTENKPRLGAKAVLQNPSSAVCLEFTDLFIALSRAAGIPAREVDGFAYTEDERQRPLSLVKDILHAWPEYYDNDRKAWIMVDPTWGNTTDGIDYFDTFDFDHLTFIIKGLDSRYPIPPGGYKLADSSDKPDVNVEFLDNFTPPFTSYQVELDLPQKVFSLLPVKGNVVIKNKGNTVFSPKKLLIQSNLRIKNNDILLPDIPPYGNLTIPLVFEENSFLTNKDAVVTIVVGEKAIQKAVKISPFIVNKWTILAGGVFLAFIFFFVFIIAKRPRYLPFFGQKR